MLMQTDFIKSMYSVVTDWHFSKEIELCHICNTKFSSSHFIKIKSEINFNDILLNQIYLKCYHFNIWALNS